MIINEGIINKLTIEQKVSLLIFKNKNDILGQYPISLDRLEDVINSVSNIVVYKNNTKTVNYNVLSMFKKEVFKDVKNLKTDNSTLNLFKTEDANEALELLKKDCLFILSKDPKTLSKTLLDKVKAAEELNASLQSEVITEEEFKTAVKNNEILLENDIDKILDRILGVILPLVDKIENPSLIKRENIDKPIFSNKTKKIMIAILAIYLNIIMYFVYGSRFDVVNATEIIVGLWVVMNLIMIFALFKLRTIKEKTNKELKEEIPTHDFEVVEPTKHEVVVSKAVFNDIDLKQLCDSFYLYLLDKGLMLEHKKIRELFSAMAASRLVVLNNKSNLNKEFLTELNNFFGNQTYYTRVNDESLTEKSIYFDEDAASEFIRGICSATDNTSNVNITSLLDVDLNTCNLYLNSIVNFSKNPNEKGSITLELKDYSISDYIVGRKLPIPKNTWFILFTKENSTEVVNNKIINEMITLDINVIEVERKESTEEFKVLSAVNFLDAINTAREKHFLSNDSWEKIDDLEKQLKSKIDFSIENKIIRKLEVYASVYKVCSDDEKSALDSTVANILLPVIFCGKEQAYSSVLDTLKDVFDDENILTTKELLTKYK